MFIIFKVFSIQGKQVKSYAEVANVSEDKTLAREFWMVKAIFQPQSVFMDMEECQLSHSFSLPELIPDYREPICPLQGHLNALRNPYDFY